jgi:hypothetical protein
VAGSHWGNPASYYRGSIFGPQTGYSEVFVLFLNLSYKMLEFLLKQAAIAFEIINHNHPPI